MVVVTAKQVKGGSRARCPMMFTWRSSCWPCIAFITLSEASAMLVGSPICAILSGCSEQQLPLQRWLKHQDEAGLEDIGSLLL